MGHGTFKVNAKRKWTQYYANGANEANLFKHWTKMCVYKCMFTNH